MGCCYSNILYCENEAESFLRLCLNNLKIRELEFSNFVFLFKSSKDLDLNRAGFWGEYFMNLNKNENEAYEIHESILPNKQLHQFKILLIYFLSLTKDDLNKVKYIPLLIDFNKESNLKELSEAEQILSIDHSEFFEFLEYYLNLNLGYMNSLMLECVCRNINSEVFIYNILISQDF